MGSSLARMDRGEEANVETMKVLIKKYEEVKRERGNRSDDSGEGESSAGTIIASISDQALYRELEQALVAAAAAAAAGSPTPRPYDDATASEGTTPPFGSAGSGSGSGSGSGGNDSSSRNNKGPPTAIQQQQQHQHQHRHWQAAAVAATTPDAPRAPTVLVVDDSNVSCQIARRGLADSNIGVKVARSGELGLALLTSNPSAFDLVLLDVAMPGLDGLQVLDRMKHDPRLCHLPVVVLSGLEDGSVGDACRQHGAVEVLRKPMSTSEVVRTVKAHCDMSRAAASSLSSSSGGSVGAYTSPPRSSPSGDVSGRFAPAHNSPAAFPPPPPPPPPPSLPPPYVSAGSETSAAETATCGNDSGNGSDRRTRSSFTSPMSASDDTGKGDRFSLSRSSSSSSNSKKGGWGDARREADASWRSPFEGGRGEAQAVPSSGTTGSHAAEAAATPPGGTLDDASGSTRRHEEPSGRKVTILVVDDSAISSRLAVHKLRSLGYETLVAVNGKTALELLRKYPNKVSFVLLDIIMPVMNGIELLQVLKTDPGLRHIPVLVVSSLEREHLDKLSVESGVMAVLKKPLDVEELQQIVKREGLALPTPPPSSKGVSESEREQNRERKQEAPAPV